MRKHLLLATLLLGCAAKPTPATTTAARPPADSSHANTGSLAPALRTLPAALEATHRSAENRARDRHRHPEQTLTFFGLAPTQHVIELWPGRGWYTEILAPYLRTEGRLTAAVPRGNYLQPYKDFLASDPELYRDVQVVELEPPSQLALGPDGSADVVLTFRNLHGWITGGYVDALHQAIFRVLKPGGVYGVVEHRAKPGTPAEESAKIGYVSEEATIAYATRAGFVLEERSEINANPSDTKDHPNGVWSLPPTFRGGDQDREKFAAIGESDRMTLRFRKPAAP